MLICMMTFMLNFYDVYDDFILLSDEICEDDYDFYDYVHDFYDLLYDL